jgi:hypothetical protein
LERGTATARESKVFCDTTPRTAALDHVADFGDFFEAITDLAHDVTSISRTQNVTLHRSGEALVIIGSGRGISLNLYLVGSIAHRDAKAGSLEHQHISWLIADRGDFTGGHVQVTRQILNDSTLVCFLVDVCQH